MKIGPRLATRCINLIFMHLRRQFSCQCPTVWWNFSLMRKFPVKLQPYGGIKLQRYAVRDGVSH